MDMKEAATLDLEQAIRDNYRLWNEGKREELDRLFAAMGPDGFTIEYVGAPSIDGPTAMADMWTKYGGQCITEPVEVIVNGSEGAAYVANRLQTPDGVVTLPSLETYKVEDGRLTIRYFHRAAH
tara:strand:- start:5819 stop:6190 length:372 start_codon:yes stop_codon:yes gene_type:complete